MHRASLTERLGCRPIQRRHAGYGSRHIFLGGVFMLERCGDDASAYRLGKQQDISRPCPALGPDLLRMHHPNGSETILGLMIGHSMAARDQRAGLANLIGASAEAPI